MKRYALLLLTIILLVAPSCTHNNGDIGPYFGTWAMTEATGIQTPPDDVREVFLQFQSCTVCLRIVFASQHTYDTVFGNWAESGGVLTLDFPDALQDGQEWYYDQYGFARHSEWRITWSSGNRRLTLTDGATTLVFSHVP